MGHDAAVNLNTSSWTKEKTRAARTAPVPIVGKDFGEDAPMLFVRVTGRKGKRQMVAAWPKFGTWGIGLWRERDGGRGTVNRPYQMEVDAITAVLAPHDGCGVPRKVLAEAVAALRLAIPWVCELYKVPMPHDPRLERPRYITRSLP